MTNTKTDGERLVKLEVKVENIEKLVTGMDSKLDSILKEQSDVRVNNVTRGELDAELKRLEEAVEGTKKRSATQIFITGSLAALFGSILTLLLSYFIQTIGR